MPDDDTIQPEQAEDTLASGAAPDPEPEPKEPEPQQPGEPGPAVPPEPSTPPATPTAPTQTYQPQPDEWDRKYEAALQKLDADEMLTESQREIEKLKLMDLHEQRQSRRVQQTESAEDRARNAAAREHGVTRDVFDATWAEAWAEARRHNLGHDAARYILHKKLSGKKPAAGANPAPQQPAAPSRTITPSGGRVPGANQRTPPPPVKKSAADQVLEQVGPLSKVKWP